MPTSSPSSPSPRRVPAARPTAIVYCEANFGEQRRQDRQRPRPPLRALRDPGRHRQHAGRPRRRRGARRRSPTASRSAPTSTTPSAAVGRPVDTFIFGVAPTSGMLSPAERDADARRHGPGHEHRQRPARVPERRPRVRGRRPGQRRDDPRRPQAHAPRRTCTCSAAASPRSPAPASPCSAPTAPSASAPPPPSSPQALNDRGIKAVLVGTGQTGLIQGARYGIALDAIPCQFCSGEMENAVVEAFEGEHPDVIIIEGQGALSHPAYLTSTFILRGSQPARRHPPARPRRAAASATSPTCRCRPRPARST